MNDHIKKELVNIAGRAVFTAFVSSTIVRPLLTDLSGRSLRRLPVFLATDLLLNAVHYVPTLTARKLRQEAEAQVPLKKAKTATQEAPEKKTAPRFGNIQDFAANHLNKMEQAQNNPKYKREVADSMSGEEIDKMIATIFGDLKKAKDQSSHPNQEGNQE